MKIAPWIFLALALSCQQQPAGPWNLDRAATMLDEGQSFQLNLKGTPPRKLEWTSGKDAVYLVAKTAPFRVKYFRFE